MLAYLLSQLRFRFVHMQAFSRYIIGLMCDLFRIPPWW